MEHLENSGEMMDQRTSNSGEGGALEEQRNRLYHFMDYNHSLEETIIIISSSIIIMDDDLLHEADEFCLEFQEENTNDNLLVFDPNQFVEYMTVEAEEPIKSERWKRKKNKRKRELGEAYDSIKKLESGGWDYSYPRPAKKMKANCECKLSDRGGNLKCRQIDNSSRKVIFEQFWKNMTWDQRKTFISTLVENNKPKDLKNRIEVGVSRRTRSLRYHLNHNGTRLRVCKKQFLNTLALSGRYVRNCLNYDVDVEGESLPFDDVLQEENITQSSSDLDNTRPGKRSRTQPRNIQKMNGLRSFLSSLPKMESHFCRKNTRKLFLEPIFQTKSEVYEIYKKESNLPIVSLKSFYKVFDEMNLSIYRPRKDQCDVCVGYKEGNVPECEYQAHQFKKECARLEKDNDNSSDNVVVTMDMQGVLLSPLSKASALYFKMKLCVHNFTFYCNKTKEVTCYLWHEGEGGVSSNEFSSIIVDFIEELNLKEGQEIILWSDGCGYQNRNVHLSNALLFLSEKLKINIIQKYLEKGHTQMEVDSIHSQIERKLRNKVIHSPAGYIEIIKSARQNPNRYRVKYLDHTFFKNYACLRTFPSIRPGYKVGDPTVSNIKALKYYPNWQIFFKLDFRDEWQPLKTRRTKIDENEVPQELPALHKTQLKIKKEKYDHLQQLKLLIPKDFHYFYDGLLH